MKHLKKSYGFYVFHVRPLKTGTQLHDKPKNAHS